MGRDKALLPWPPSAIDGQTLLTSSIDALKPFAESVIVVAGKNLESLRPLAAACGAMLVENPEPERGQFSSLQVGLREVVARGCEAAIITLVDSPPLSPASLQMLRAAFDRALAQGKWAVVPEHNGKRGHPLFANRALIESFLSAPLTSTAREIRRQHAELIESVPVSDTLLTVDVNTPEQYAALRFADRSST